MNKILIDTCIWSEVFRRKNPDKEIQNKMKKLILNLNVIMIGPVRQELLSGIKDESKFAYLQKILSVFQDEPIISEDYILAAKLCNKCRQHGIQGSQIDFLICALSIRLDVEIYTVDIDFQNYSKFIPIKLFA